MRAALAEREREAAARVAVAEERARIARELHDIVAHAVSVMVLQVGAVRHKLPDALVEDSDALRRRRAGRPHGARRDAPPARRDAPRRRRGVELAPQPGLDGLDALLDEVGRAGLPVELHVDGEPVPLPRAIDLSAYRIVQEGLTNALKHARASRADVTVRYGPDELEIEVRDDGARRRGGDGLGHGLVGIRERVKIYGGEMTAGTRRGGGFVLSARLPLERRPAVSIRVLVADDQSMVRAGFRMLLSGEEDIEVVAEASNGLEAVDKAARFRPTVVLMDIRMPELDGLEATRRILAADDAGPDPDPDDLRPRRVRLRGAARRRQRLRPQGRPARAADRRDPHRRRRRRAALTRRHEARDPAVHAHAARAPPKELDDLTERELEVFRLIARGLSNAEIGRRALHQRHHRQDAHHAHPPEARASATASRPSCSPTRQDSST